jgi:integrase
VAKGGAKRDFWISQNALERISTYMQIDRKAAIDRAKYEGRYSELGGMIVAEKVTRNRDLVFHDDRGVRHSAALDELASEVRAKVFREVEGELEPASLWLSEAGLPMPPESWEAIFRTANQRCAAHGVAIHCYPHMLRHSFALKMLVTLMHAFDRRMGLSPAERQEYRMLFGDPWVLVQTMLGHRSPETTRDTYLEPVKGLQVDHFLNDSNDDDFPIDALLSRIAEASPRVKDDP